MPLCKQFGHFFFESAAELQLSAVVQVEEFVSVARGLASNYLFPLTSFNGETESRLNAILIDFNRFTRPDA